MRKMAKLCSLVVSVWLLLGVGAALHAAGEPPDVLVKRTVDDVMEAIKQTRDRATLRKVAEQKVLPYFDFQEMTRLAVGAAWRKATPEQQKALENSFRTLLVNTYTNALAQAGPNANRTIEVKPAAASKEANDVVVRTLIKEAGKQPLSIDYRMQNKDGQWKVYDVTVEGVSLVTNYRTTFAEEVSRGGIDGLIKSLEERNRTLAKS
jgi:phospholipid transport system substrate-binding protein